MRSAAIAVVPSFGRFLTVARPEPPHEQALPGGHVEPGETPAEAMAREVEEETGIRPVSFRPLGTGSHAGTRVSVFLVTGFRGMAHPREGLPVRWMTWPELRAQAARFGKFLDQTARSLPR